MNNVNIIEKLKTILTIDGKGRPEKAKLLLELMDTLSPDELRRNIEEISKRIGY